MVKRFRKALSLLVCIVFVFSFYSSVVLGAKQEGKLLQVVDGTSIILITDNSKNTIIVAEKDGNKLFATIDKKSNEIKLKSVEKSNSKLRKNTEKNFSVKIHEFNRITKKDFEASITEVSTNKTIGIKSLSHNSAIAEWFFIPYLTYVAVEALILAILYTTALTLTVVAAYEVSEVLEDRFKKSNPTIIYRWGTGTPYNLTPRPDELYLSYSLIKPVSGYTATTLSAVNASKKLIAIIDGASHVSVAPVNYSRMQEWKDSRNNANNNPHEFTEILLALSVKVK